MRGPRTWEGAAGAALLLYLLLPTPCGVAAVEGGGSGVLRAAVLASADAQVTAARCDLAQAQAALAAAQGAAGAADADPSAHQDTLLRLSAEVASLADELREYKALHRVALAQASRPPPGSEGASGSGLRSGTRAAPKRALQTESDEDDGIDLDDSAARNAKGKRAANLAELPRTITAPPLGFIDAEGKVHRKHALFAVELGADLGLCWGAADVATALRDECTRCITASTALDPSVVHQLAAEILAPIAELIGCYADRGLALNVEHKYGQAVAREFVGDSPLSSPADQRRLKRAQAAARESVAAAARPSGGAGGLARSSRRSRIRASSGGGRGAASGANASPLGGGGRGGGRGPRGVCFGCQLPGHVRKDCPTNP
jgi:hypothetical protein